MKTTTTKKPAAKSGVHLETSRYGISMPTYYLVPSAVARMSHREVNAALFKLAAEIETLTVAMGSKEGWIVQIDREAACVYLELGEGDEAEAKRGMDILRAVERA
jgi:hypothetical protein